MQQMLLHGYKELIWCKNKLAVRLQILSDSRKLAIYS